MRLAADVQLRLVETEAEATTLLQVQLELERRPRLLQGKQQAGAAGSEGKQQWQASSGGAAGGGGAGGGEAAPVAAGGGKRSAAAVLAALDEPPGVLEVMRGAGKLGPHETWAATVQVSGGGANPPCPTFTGCPAARSTHMRWTSRRGSGRRVGYCCGGYHHHA